MTLLARKNRIGLQFSGFKELTERLDSLNGDLTRTTEEALKKSKELVTENLKKATVKENYPAQGKYSHGGTAKSIREENDVSWSGTTAEIKVGFEFKESGLKSLFLMYGTPRMKKVQSIYDAVYGNKTKSQIRKIQKETFQNAINGKMG